MMTMKMNHQKRNKKPATKGRVKTRAKGRTREKKRAKARAKAKSNRITARIFWTCLKVLETCLRTSEPLPDTHCTLCLFCLCFYSRVIMWLGLVSCDMGSHEFQS